jgi:phage regulator Rha-like protein
MLKHIMDNLTIAVACGIEHSQIRNQIEFAVLGKTQQIQKQQGDAAVQLIQQSADIQQQLASGHIDVTL